MATAGAASMLGFACSSSGTEGSTFGVVDAGEEQHALMGFVSNPEAGDDGMAMGFVVNPDAGDETWAMGLVDAGIIANPEAGDENQPMGAIDGAVGVVANPEAGHD